MMRHVRTDYSSLHDLIEKITVYYISETLISKKSEFTVIEALTFMDAKGFDVIGVAENNKVVGYVKKEDLVKVNEGKDKNNIGIYKKNIDQNKLSYKDSIHKAFKLLENYNQIFIEHNNNIVSIVTKGDLQKIPVRMWLFSIVSLLEMHFTCVIRDECVKNGEDKVFGETILKKAKETQADRKKNKVELDLVECLQLCDKRDILKKTETFMGKMGCSCKEFENKIKKLEKKLRNPLAHSCDMVFKWPEAVELVKFAENIIKKCEG